MTIALFRPSVGRIAAGIAVNAAASIRGSAPFAINSSIGSSTIAQFHRHWPAAAVRRATFRQPLTGAEQLGDARCEEHVFDGDGLVERFGKTAASLIACRECPPDARRSRRALRRRSAGARPQECGGSTVSISSRGATAAAPPQTSMARAANRGRSCLDACFRERLQPREHAAESCRTGATREADPRGRIQSRDHSWRRNRRRSRGRRRGLLEAPRRFRRLGSSQHRRFDLRRLDAESIQLSLLIDSRKNSYSPPGASHEVARAVPTSGRVRGFDETFRRQFLPISIPRATSGPPSKVRPECLPDFASRAVDDLGGNAGEGNTDRHHREPTAFRGRQPVRRNLL